MSIHDWGLFADSVMQVIKHPDIPVTNKEARLQTSVVHVAGNWMAQPKAHGIEGDLPLKKLHQCTDAEQIIHIIQKAIPEIKESTLESTLRKVHELSHKSVEARGKPAEQPHHDIAHDRDVVVGFLQSAMGQIGKMKDISTESKHGATTLLHDASQAARNSSAPLTTLQETEEKLETHLKKDKEKFHSFLNWFHQSAKGLQRKLV